MWGKILLQIFLQALKAYAIVLKEITPRKIRAFIGLEDLNGVKHILPTIARFEDFTSVSFVSLFVCVKVLKVKVIITACIW